MRVGIVSVQANSSVKPVAEGKTISLIGLMGAGKSTVGRRLADALRLPFYDSDHEIEEAAGLSVSDIFSIHGEAEFRRGEQKVIERLVAGQQHVLATGGGAFMNDTTRGILLSQTVTVWLRADLETLWKRVNKRPTRPLLNTSDPKKTLSDLLDQRCSTYAQAQIVIDSNDGPHGNAVDAILTALQDGIVNE